MSQKEGSRNHAYPHHDKYQKGFPDYKNLQHKLKISFELMLTKQQPELK